MRDYLGLLRRQRLVILLVAAAFALGGLAIGFAQHKEYTATASVAYKDITAILPLLNGNVSALPAETPAQRSARNAQFMTSPALAAEVKRKLHTAQPASTLSAAISAAVAVQTGLVTVQAQWKTPDFAAKLANAFARASVARATHQQRRQVKPAIKALELKLSKQPPNTVTRQVTESQIAQLQGVEQLAKAGQITEPATAPSSPTSPKPGLNLVLGGFVGLVFGLLVGFVRDSLDRKIRGSRDAHEELGFPVLASVGVSALGSTGLAARNGRFVKPQDLESFRVLRTNLAFFDPNRPLRTILVTSGLAEEGKSTVAAALASAAVAAGQRALLVDGDLRRPTLAERLGISRSPGLADYLAGRAGPQEILRLHTLALNGDSPDAANPGVIDGVRTETAGGSLKADPQLVFIASGDPPSQPAELLASDRCHDFLAKVGKAYDLVVIDSSPMLAVADSLELIPYVDAVLVCVRVSWSTREEVRAIRHALSRLPERPTGIVVTGLKTEGEEYGYYGYEYAAS